eukprot:357475-Chlamydomonas_euryale.AAC.3
MDGWLHVWLHGCMDGWTHGWVSFAVRSIGVWLALSPQRKVEHMRERVVGLDQSPARVVNGRLDHVAHRQRALQLSNVQHKACRHLRQTRGTGGEFELVFRAWQRRCVRNMCVGGEGRWTPLTCDIQHHVLLGPMTQHPTP